jgi:hypothetical protein
MSRGRCARRPADRTWALSSIRTSFPIAPSVQAERSFITDSFFEEYSWYRQSLYRPTQPIRIVSTTNSPIPTHRIPGIQSAAGFRPVTAVKGL